MMRLRIFSGIKERELGDERMSEKGAKDRKHLFKPFFIFGRHLFASIAVE